MKLIQELYRLAYGKWYDFLYKITKNDKYLIYWETPFYTNDVALATPLDDELPFFLYIPFDQEKGNEYFIVANGYNTKNCKKATKLSLRKPKYFKGGILTGKKKWIFTHTEKEKLNVFLNDNTDWVTSGRTWFNDMIVDYNTALSSTEIPEDLPMPDYMQLPEKN